MSATTIGERLERLRRIAPHGPTPNGQLYSKASQTKRRAKRITLYTLFESSEGTYLLRDHMFESKKEPRSPAEWSAWLSEHLGAIHRNAILPGLEIRTRKTWSVLRIVGWVAGVKH